MEKVKKIIFGILITMSMLTPTKVLGEGSYNVVGVGTGNGTSFGDTICNCYKVACRGSNVGVRVTLYYIEPKSGKVVSKDITSDSHFSTSGDYSISDTYKNWSDHFLTLDTISKTNFPTVKEFVTSFSKEKFYSFLIENDSIFILNDANKINTNSKKTKVTSNYTYEQYEKLLRSIYIVAEPVVRMTLKTNSVIDNNSKVAENAKAKLGFKPTDCDMRDMAIKGTISLSNFPNMVSVMGIRMDNVGQFKADDPKVQELVKYQICKTSNLTDCTNKIVNIAMTGKDQNPLLKYIEGWNYVVNNFKRYGETAEKTVREWAAYVMEGNYDRLNANADGTPKSDSGLSSYNIGKVSHYMQLNKNIGFFTSANAKATTWAQIYNPTSGTDKQGNSSTTYSLNTNGYGVNVIHVTAKFVTPDDYCTYDEDTDTFIIPDKYEAKDCCFYTDNEGIPLWESKTVFEAEKLKFENKTYYQKYCTQSISSCGKEQYDAIAAGKSLDTPITFVTRKNGKETTTTTTLRACCEWNAYIDPEGNHTIKDKITEDQFNKTKKEFCEVCSINEYNAIVNDGEANPNTRPVSILTKLSPVIINGVQQKYQYCCDSYDNYGENQLPKKITKDNFDKEFKEKYCENPDRKCGEAEFNKLVKYNKKVLNGSLKESALASNDKYKISIGGETVSILVCCSQDEYEPNVAKTLNNKSGVENIFQPAPPNFDATNKKLKLKICQNDTSYCTYDVLRNATKVEDTIVTINGVKRNCCEWDGYGSTDEERAKNSTYSDATKFQTDSKYLELCSPSCTWNGNSTERLQYINKEEKNCCYYKNYGAVAKEALAKFKDPANGVDGVKSQKDLEKTGWYKKYCSESKCSLSKMKVDDKVFADCCSEEIDSFGENDQILLRPYGSVPSYLAINESERFYSLCKSSREFCSYTVSPQCPDCNGDAFSTGKTVDTVNGEDSTLFTVSDSVLKCIVKNELGGPNYDGYLYKDLGSEYCPVLCTQKVEYDYPKKSALNVQGGRYIPTSAIQPKINTVLTCRINKVDVKQFESDLKAAKAELEAAYEAYSKAKIPLNNNQAKIDTHNEDGKNGFCDCKKNQTYHTTDGKCCSKANQATYTSVTTGILTKSTDGRNPNSCSSYSVSVTGKGDCTSSCSSYGGVSSYSYTCTNNKTGSRDDDDPKRCQSAGGSISSYSCSCNSCVSYVTCSSGYTASGSECVKYTCADTISINGETGYLNTSESSYGATTSPKCVYDYCETRDYTRYKSQTVQEYKYAVNETKTQGKQNDKTCENNDDYYEKVYKKEVEATKKRLSDAKKAYENVIENFQKCFKVDEQMRTYSDYEVKLHLDYLNGEDGNPYAVSTYLTDSVSVGTANNFKFELYTYSKCDLPFDWANGGHGKLTCSNQTMNIFVNAKNEIYTAQATRNFTFTLPDTDVYKYVNKNSFSEKEKNINSVMIGSHLPVAFNEKGKEVIVKLKPEFTGSVIKPKFEEDLCTNEYICKGGGIEPCVEPVYRPISLSKPFLDEDGLVRNTGINWCDGTDCSSNNALVQKVITNNRGVTTDQVYKLTPLYTIRLTPSIVKKIRFYNSITTYGDYNLICDEGTGRHCKSVYIRGGAGIDGSNVTNDLTSIKAVDYSRSCALTENLSGCMPGDFYEKR